MYLVIVVIDYTVSEYIDLDVRFFRQKSTANFLTEDEFR